MILILVVFGLSSLTTVTLQCAPHSPSRPWTNTTHVCSHHHQTVENYYFDNRTIYNKLVEIEKRVENIEKKENMIPVQPPTKEDPDKKPEGPALPELEESCLSCSSDPLVSEDCDNCLKVSVSPPFDYYSCMAINVKCGDGAKKLKISESYQLNIVEKEYVINCQKGGWVMRIGSVEQKVEAISCLSS
ncbi:unnamed protein product [Caenorhabditis sp. 36 PRJEB53466]|nr:unnamed protein product [Caenorhabditis sp. 36 PRJEB53466]